MPIYFRIFLEDMHFTSFITLKFNISVGSYQYLITSILSNIYDIDHHDYLKTLSHH